MSLLIHPDRPPRRDFLDAVRSVGLDVVVHHASGNPWVFGLPGCVPDLDVRSGDLHVLVLGPTPLSVRDVTNRIATGRVVAHLDALVDSLPGPMLLVATDRDGMVRVQGSSTGTSAVFWSVRSHGTALASDDAQLLARVVGASVDLDELVVRLSDAEVSHPYSGGVIWTGIQPVPPGSWLRLAAWAPASVIRSWSPPAPESRLDELAAPLGVALREAVCDAMTPGSDVSSDLSGGLDSTTVAYAAHEVRPDLQTVFLRSRDSANADHQWSTRASEDLGSVHHVLDYAAATGTDDDDLASRLPEGPSESARYLTLVSALELELAGARPVVHLNGHGGDELFGAVPAMPWSLIRSRHTHRLRNVLRFQRVNKQALPATLRLLARRGTPWDDLRSIAASDLAAPYDPYSQGSRWVPPVQVPSCLTTEARDRFRASTRAHQERDDLVLHPDRTSHQVREAVLFHGALLRRMNLLRPHGSQLTFVAPLLDDRVVRLAMSLDIDDRFSTTLIKPLLARARPATMPVEYFQRRDKGEYSAETYTSFRAVQDRIRQTFADGSTLEELGLLDADLFRRLLSRYSPDGETHEQVMRIDLAERWLRSVATLEPSSSVATAQDGDAP